MRIYEYFRKTKETFIASQINLDIFKDSNINLDIGFFKHILFQFIFNSLIKINLLALGDIYVDYHHLVEDTGIILGKIFNYSILDFNIYRYGFFFNILDDSLSRVVIDLSGRSYLKYLVIYNKLYLYNFDIDLFFDFLLSFVNNFNITLHIENLYGINMHHKIETIFKSLGNALKIAIKKNFYIISTKGLI